MADGFDNLGKASLDLTARTVEFDRNIAGAHKTAQGMENQLDALAAVSKIAEDALQRVKMKPGQGAESKASAEGILSGVRGISEEARDAARELDHVKLTSAQAAESDAAGDVIDRKLKSINRNANETRRALDRVKIAGGVPGRSGVGVGPFGSGFGRVGVLGAAIGAGTLLAPAAGPGAAGLLAAIPGLAFGAAGAVGTLALAFQGVGKAVGGDAKAFKDLGPAAQKFVLTIRSLDGWFDKLKQTAAGSLFPGLTAGLKAALSPGTTGALTTGVQQFGAALGQAGAQWGKYFGSTKFQQLLGPLMQAGARNMVVLSDAVLHLFDAFAVLGRAAIPFTSWLVKGIDAGSRFASSWLRAKEATGGLGHAMDEAKTSLRLVGGLLASLLRVVGALGKALYPVSKVAVKALTDGLNALARIIQRNRQTIREIVGGALAAFVTIVRTAATVVRRLWPVLQKVVDALGGWKHAFEILIGLQIAKVVSGWATSFTKAGTAAETSSVKVGRLSRGLGKLGGIGTITIGLVFYSEFKGPAKRFFEKYLGADFSDITADKAGASTVVSKFKLTAPKGTSLDADLARIKTGKPLTKGQITDVINAFKRGDLTGGDIPSKKDIATLIDDLEHPGKGLPQPATKSTKSTTAHPGDAGSPFGKAPPFTKNTGATKAPVIPAGASHAEALASANASRAGALGNVGKAAKRFLEAELGDLGTADKLLHAKYASATGAARTQLFAAITSVENKMRTVRARIKKAIRDDRAAELQFAVDQAKDAVASATVGSAAYGKATKAEERALKAQIAYLDKRAHNSKLSLEERSKAIKKETADKKALAALLKPDALNKGANEAQFLASIKQIYDSFGSNFYPQPAGGGKTDTHLYDMKTELRHQTRVLTDIQRGGRFPASAYATDSALAVTG